LTGCHRKSEGFFADEQFIEKFNAYAKIARNIKIGTPMQEVYKLLPQQGFSGGSTSMSYHTCTAYYLEDHIVCHIQYHEMTNLLEQTPILSLSPEPVPQYTYIDDYQINGTKGK
jgi:hypothetical protein